MHTYPRNMGGLMAKLAPFLLFFLFLSSSFGINNKIFQESVLPVGYGGTLKFCGNGSMCTIVFSDGALISPEVAFAVNYTEAYTKVLYSWMVVGRKGNFALIHVNLTLITNHIAYLGKKYVEMAKNGDLSFAKWVNTSSVRVVIENGSCGEGCKGGPAGEGSFVGVIFLGNITVRRSMNLTLDVNNGMVSYNGKVLGRWVPWINVARYPLSGSKREFLMKWLGTNITWEVRMMDRKFETRLFTLERYYMGAIPLKEARDLAQSGPENRSLHTPLSFMMLGVPLIGNVYSPEGMLVGSSTGIYVDPALYKMGVVIIEGIDAKEGLRGDSRGFELIKEFRGMKESSRSYPLPSNLVPYIALILIILAVLALIVQRRSVLWSSSR